MSNMPHVRIAQSPQERAQQINRAMADVDLFGGAQRPIASGQNSTFRISPEPFYLEPEAARRLAELGPVFHAFYQAANRLYQQSVRGSAPDFFRAYLEQGKPERVIELNRLNRFKHDLPLVIRPDIILTENGPIVTELDSVPGGMGVLAFLSQQYAALGYDLPGGPNALTQHFVAALRTLRPELPDPLVAVVVSDESADYRGEMTWLAQAMCAAGLRTRVCHPRELRFRDNGLYLPIGDDAAQAERVDIVYRFFELFDLKNIPQADLILYAVRKEMVAVTPPLKSQLEEKLLFALFHHPVLKPYWQAELPPEAWEALAQMLPKTWVLDPRPLPPHAVIPDLVVGGKPVTNFLQLADATQRERELVAKPSGFSPDAWGSRGVTIGHDVPAVEWGAKLAEALGAFDRNPYVLQQFHKARKDTVTYYDFAACTLRVMPGRARLCPYYFVVDGKAQLAGVLATIAPLNKKAIHGMVDAVMAPVAVK